MKKITLFLCLMSFAMWGQNSLTAEDAQHLDQSNNGDNSTAISNHQRDTEEVTAFTDRTVYLEACSNGDLLTLEDLADGPGGFLACSSSISSAGDVCYPAGEIVEGIEFTTSGADAGNTMVAVVPSDGFTEDNAVGSITFADFTIINFSTTDAVTSVGFDLYSLTGGSNVDVRVIGADGIIDTVTADVTTTGPTFVGVIADEPILSIELEDLTGANVELVAQVLFGSCAPPPLNDDPETAATLTVGEVFEDFPVIGDNTEATATAIDDPSCGNFTEADLWYTFVVPESGSVSVESQEDDGSITDTAISIYEGEVGALVEVVCNDDGGIGLFSLAEVEGRTPGEVLYARVWEWNGGSLGTIQMSAYDTPPPANDDPEGAIALTVGSVFTDFPVTATNVSATDTMIDDPSCGNYGGADVWFTVQVPSTGQLDIEVDTAGGITDTGMSIYSGEIGALVEVDCDDDDGNGLFSLINLTNQEAGSTLYIRVWEWGGGGFGPFQIAAYSDCAVNGGEIALANGDTEAEICIEGGGDAVNATLGGMVMGTNSQWVITDTDAVILALPAPPPFDLTPFGEGTVLLWHLSFEDGLMGAAIGESALDLEGCFDLSNPITAELVVEGGVCEVCEYTLEMNDSFGDGWNGAIMDVLVDGVVVLDDVGLDDDPNNDGTQGFLMFPVNSTADVTTVFVDGGGFPGEVSYRILDANGIEVGVGNVDTNIDTGSITADCPSCPAPFNLAAGNFAPGSVDLTWSMPMAALGYNWEVQDVGVPQGDPGAIAAGSAFIDTFDTATGAFVDGNTYTFYLQAGCTEDDFSIYVSIDFLYFLPPTNDDCENAIEIFCGDTVTGTTTTASDSGSNAAPDVFYTYTPADVAQDVLLSLCDGGTDYDSLLRVFDDECNLVSEIAVNDDTCGLQSEVEFFAAEGTTYTIMVEGFGASSGNYSLAITCEDNLSVESAEFNNFSFYPNPAQDRINLDAQQSIEQVTIFNMLGQQVLNQKVGVANTQLDVSNLASGNYIMQVIIDGQKGVYKVLKQ